LNNLIGTEDVAKSSNDDYNGYEQAPYTVVTTIDETIEVRTYPTANWACTRGTMDYRNQTGGADDGVLGIFNYFTRDRSQDENGRLFWRLFRYIQGENEGNHKIEMTVPVITKMSIADGQLTKLMCFYIPKLYQTSPPQPTDPLVLIVKTDQFTAIVKRFGGYIMENALWIRKAEQFKKEIIAKGIAGYDFSDFTTAGYDSPMTFWNRRNEIFFMQQ